MRLLTLFLLCLCGAVYAGNSTREVQWQPEAIRQAGQLDIRNLARFSDGIPEGLTRLVTTPTAQQHPQLWPYFLAGAEVWHNTDQACFYNPFVDAFLRVQLGVGGISRIEVGLGQQPESPEAMPAWLLQQRPPGVSLLDTTSKARDQWELLPANWKHLPIIEARLLGGYNSVPTLIEQNSFKARRLREFVPAFQHGKIDTLLRMNVKLPNLPPTWRAGAAPYYAVLGDAASVVFFVNRRETGRFIALVLGKDGQLELEVFNPGGLD